MHLVGSVPRAFECDQTIVNKIEGVERSPGACLEDHSRCALAVEDMIESGVRRPPFSYAQRVRLGRMRHPSG
jgi:hypothetical protein